VCAADGAHLSVEWWSVLPFASLLACIAILPLVAGHFWHSNWRRALVAFGLAGLIAAYLVNLGDAGTSALEHALWEYVDFIMLLVALYAVAGGICVQGRIPRSALLNTLMLMIGAVLANAIGTTGASMLLIRPFLRANLGRKYQVHLPVFFIIVVSNVGGLLTPLGDPPLFLGFLHGVEFFWTMALWPQWLLVNGAVLSVFLVWDCVACWREPERQASVPNAGRLRIGGLHNAWFLMLIIAAILCQSRSLLGHLGLADYALTRPWPSIILAGVAFLSWLLTPSAVRRANDFDWDAMIEVAILFLGIFVTMVPALALLTELSRTWRPDSAWQYFWLTGSLSSFLDNAPTYLTFATVAAGGQELAPLMTQQPRILQAISAGAVFMGANTYVGNGPNFMVKAIAESMGYKTPSFFGYMLYVGCILLPIFVVVTYLFYWP
jgi:Na+/H+ antiporter NhaD/arsenite permease-like protein